MNRPGREGASGIELITDNIVVRRTRIEKYPGRERVSTVIDEVAADRVVSAVRAEIDPIRLARRVIGAVMIRADDGVRQRVPRNSLVHVTQTIADKLACIAAVEEDAVIRCTRDDIFSEEFRSHDLDAG